MFAQQPQPETRIPTLGVCTRVLRSVLILVLFLSILFFNSAVERATGHDLFDWFLLGMLAMFAVGVVLVFLFGEVTSDEDDA